MSPRPRPAIAALRLAVVCALLLAGALAARDGLEDRDGDGIADRYDPFPDDPERPGRTEPDTIYANTSAELYRVGDAGRSIQRVGSFTFSDGRPRAVTDIAIDPWGVMWASSFDAIMVCHPMRAHCEVLAPSGASLNALEHARRPSGDAAAHGLGLYGASTDGGLFRVDRSGHARRIGELGGPSSGDLVPFGDFIGAARDEGAGLDTLVAFSAVDLARREIGPLPGGQIYGMARCDGGEFFAFDASGQLHRSSRAGAPRWEQVEPSRHAWWGASCSPAVFGLPGERGAEDPSSADPRAPAPGPGEDPSPRPDPAPGWCTVR